MPFTFSHPAIVLPLTRLPKKFVSLTGLVAGSVVPDFEYFIRMRVNSVYSHTLAGVFWYDLPLGVLLAFVFHLLVRDALILNLPLWFRKRMIVFTRFSWPAHFRNYFPAVILSTIIGSISHLLWDGFTHDEGLFVKHIPLLQHVFILSRIKIPLYEILQHASTLAGAAVILYAIKQLPVVEKAEGKISFRYWISAAVITVFTIMAGAMAGQDYLVYGQVIITGISGGLIGLVVAPQLGKIKVK